MPEGEFQLGVFAYSTYVTSAWLWLFLLTSVTMRVIWSITRALQQNKMPFDVTDAPIRTLAIVACIAIILTFPVVLALYSILTGSPCT